MLKKIDYAYEILSDEQKRLFYDTFFHRPLELITGHPTFDNIKTEINNFAKISFGMVLKRMTDMDYSELLGVNHDFTVDQINEAYNRAKNMIEIMKTKNCDLNGINYLDLKTKQARDHYLKRKEKKNNKR